MDTTEGEENLNPNLSRDLLVVFCPITKVSYLLVIFIKIWVDLTQLYTTG